MIEFPNNLISFTEHQEQNQIEEQQPLSPAQRIKEDMYRRNNSAVSPEQIDSSNIEPVLFIQLQNKNI